MSGHSTHVFFNGQCVVVSDPRLSIASVYGLAQGSAWGFGGVGAVGTTIPAPPVPRRRSSLNDLPLGGCAAGNDPDGGGAWGAESAEGGVSASDLAFVGAADG